MIGQIVYAARSRGQVTGAVRVNEGDGRGPVEYTATVSAVDQSGQPLDAASLKAALISAWQAQRALRPQAPADLSGAISGVVNL